MSNKIVAFEYVVFRLLEWYSEKCVTGGSCKNDFSILKCLKLLFFVTAANTYKGKRSLLLEEVFSDYYAMPFGHVESAVYEILRNQPELLECYVIDNQCTTVKDLDSTLNLPKKLDSELKEEIDSSIRYLKSQNQALVCLSAFDLVDLSHHWYSWQHYYQRARRNSQRSIAIPTDAIKDENKIFSL